MNYPTLTPEDQSIFDARPGLLRTLRDLKLDNLDFVMMRHSRHSTPAVRNMAVSIRNSELNFKDSGKVFPDAAMMLGREAVRLILGADWPRLRNQMINTETEAAAAFEAPARVACADGCVNTPSGPAFKGSAITDAERDVYRNSNQY